MVQICMECGRPARFQLKTFDEQTIYLCEDHVKGWHVSKITEIKPREPTAKSSENLSKKEQEK